MLDWETQLPKLLKFGGFGEAERNAIMASVGYVVDKVGELDVRASRHEELTRRLCEKLGVEAE